MSRSTKVEVTAGATTVGYTFGTGTVAERLGVFSPNTPMRLSGDAARSMLQHGCILPERELNFIVSVLAKLDKDNEVFLEQNPEYTLSDSVSMMAHLHNDVHVSIVLHN